MTPEEIKALEDRVAKAEAAASKQEETNANLLAMVNVKGAASNSNSDEQQALRYFGCRSAKDLLSVNTCDARFQHVPENLKFLVSEFKKDFDTSRMIQQIVNGESLDRGAVETDKFTHVKGVLDGNYFAKNVLAPKLKAFGTSVSGEGAEWVPTIVSSSYIEEFELNRQVVSQFRPITMPSSPFDMPIQTDVTTARRQAESGSAAANIASANFGTGKITLQAEKLVEHMVLPEELNEDSAPGILALVRSEIVEAQARAFEAAILNGDTAGTHMDSDVTGTVDARTAWNGLRKLAIANSANGATIGFGGAAVTTPKLREMRSAMGKFGVAERDLVWVVSSKIYHQMRALPEVTSVEKFGPMATILRGALAAFDGVPIVITEHNRDDLSATGVYDGVTTNLSEVKLVNRSRFMWGTRRPIRVRAVQDPTPPGDRWLMASWWRGDFKGHAQSANEVSIALGINVL